MRTDLALATLDALAVVCAYTSTLVLRFDGSVPGRYWDRFWAFVPLVVVAHLLANLLWRLYGPMWKHASVQEARRVLMAGGSTVLVMYAFHQFRLVRIPTSVVILGGVAATILLGFVRFQSRLFAFNRNKERTGLRVVVVGAGSTGAAVIREMLRSPDSGLYPVAIVDDDRHKLGRRLVGVPVAGRVSDLESVVDQYDAQQVLLAVKSHDGALVSRVAQAAERAEVVLKVLPGMKELLGTPRVRDARDVRIEDLLGREEVSTDLESVARMLEGRRVLITGAGGSIGAEIARQVAEFGPASLVLLDHDETHLHDLSTVLHHPCTEVLADIREAAAVQRVFRRHRPEIVFHAAAHKHVPLLESHGTEAVHTNVLGTTHVVNAAAQIGTKHLVFISTDKAVRPSSVMGASKALGEQLVVTRAPVGTNWCAVRFGNVVGSRGSVIPTFARQIASGGPVTVTDPRMTRFFMSIEEAVQLVLQAAAFADGGEIFMLEMGEPVNILQLAQRMIRISGYADGEIPITVTGARPGEKIAEELRAPGETTWSTPHPGIVGLYPLVLVEEELEDGLRALAKHADDGDDTECKRVLMDLTARVGVPLATRELARGPSDGQ